MSSKLSFLKVHTQSVDFSESKFESYLSKTTFCHWLDYWSISGFNWFASIFSHSSKTL